MKAKKTSRFPSADTFHTGFVAGMSWCGVRIEGTENTPLVAPADARARGAMFAEGHNAAITQLWTKSRTK